MEPPRELRRPSKTEPRPAPQSPASRISAAGGSTMAPSACAGSGAGAAARAEVGRAARPERGRLAVAARARLAVAAVEGLHPGGARRRVARPRQDPPGARDRLPQAAAHNRGVSAKSLRPLDRQAPSEVGAICQLPPSPPTLPRTTPAPAPTKNPRNAKSGRHHVTSIPPPPPPPRWPSSARSRSRPPAPWEPRSRTCRRTGLHRRRLPTSPRRIGAARCRRGSRGRGA